MMDLKKLIAQHFPDDVVEVEGILKFTLRMPNEKIVHYLNIGCTDKNINKLTICVDHDDDEFAIELLKNDVKPLEEPITIINTEFKNKKFDSILMASGLYHRQLRGIVNENRSDFFLCLPIFKSEFFGNETEKDFLDTCAKFTPVYNWNREKNPKSVVAFSNPKTGGGTIKKGVVLAFPIIKREVNNMDAVENGTMLITNYKNEKLDIRSSSKGFSLKTNKIELTLSNNELVNYIWYFISF